MRNKYPCLSCKEEFKPSINDLSLIFYGYGFFCHDCIGKQDEVEDLRCAMKSYPILFSVAAIVVFFSFLFVMVSRYGDWLCFW